MALLMTSEAVEGCGILPMRYSCFGDNVQQGFDFAGAPAGVVTYALIFHDLPATSGRDQLPLAMEGSTLAKAAYIGRFRRPS
jgi:phosphatidylethanolamine-binding protein (PEBP) family uncharacterized protein